MTPVTVPPVFAAPGEPLCNDRYAAQGGTRCGRPQLHAGGHLDPVTGKYWQAVTPEPEPAPLPAADDPCECAHGQDEHDDADDSDAGRAAHGCLHPGCGCARYRWLGKAAS